jgi:tetratricopeptide (TPR) repeat protein
MTSKSPSAAIVVVSLTAVMVAAGCRSGSGPGAGGATVSEKKEIIRTYPYADPDPVPIFARSSLWGQGLRLYPYFFYDTFSAAATDREWTVVRLENPYVRVAVLPEVGGKVWGAADKSSGRDFLYTNHVMKFRQIALRGPWTSGGIEFNFGIVGHAPSTASPVDHIIRQNADGSASCVVGTMDLPSRTRWSVTITLPADKAFFETNGFWHNPTPFSQSYYYWSCAAIRTADDLRYIFPGRVHIGHDYSVPLEPWPVSPEGRDLSWYKNNDSPGSKSYFTVGEYEDFYGAWYKDSDAGFGHWALYDDMPGRKVWIWDLSRQGGIWVDLLTDKDGQYTEPQAGRLLNQSDHGRLFPSITDRWKELWFPYRGIGPMRKASPIGVLSAAETGTGLAIGFFPLQSVDEDLVVRVSGKDVYKERLRLKPEGIFRKEIPLGAKPEAYEVRIGPRLVYSSGPESRELGRPLRFRAVDERTAEGLYLAGARSEQERLHPQALEKYLACLAREPLHLRALARTAELYARRGEYRKGLDYAAKALDVSMYDPEANYVYGLIARRLGRLADAKETLGWASRSMEYRSPAYVQLAEIAAFEANFPLALEYAEKALDSNRYNSSAFEIKAVALRRLGKADMAREALDQLEEFDPLDHLGRFERYLLERTEARLSGFKSMIRNELPHESYLEMALFYVRNGCVPDAVTLLENAPAQPEVCVWLAYLLKDTARDQSAIYLDRAFGLSPLLVFPFREESIPVFEWAMASRPADWKPKYYLGLIFWAKGRIEKTRDLFARCDAADFAPFFLARSALERETAPEKALADLNRALGIDGRNWRVWHSLVGFLQTFGRNGEALAVTEKAAGLFPAEVPLLVDQVKSLLDLSRNDEATAVVDKIQALPYEGASDIYGLYVKAHIAVALDRMGKRDWAAAVEHLEKAKLYPETLGTGAPAAPDVRLQDYFEILCQEKMGNQAKAMEIRKSILDYTDQHGAERGPSSYFGALVLERAGQPAKAREIFTWVAPPRAEILEAIKKFSR